MALPLQAGRAQCAERPPLARRCGADNYLTEVEDLSQGRGTNPTALEVKLKAAMAGDGALAAHSKEARQEAGLKLRNNHDRVLADVCNSSPSLNIDGKPLTQRELVRVSPEHMEHADEALHEIARRLLGEGLMEPPTVEAGMVWGEVAVYLDGRIHSTATEKPGRKPDMSPPAAAAMRAVLQQMRYLGWDPNLVFG